MRYFENYCYHNIAILITKRFDDSNHKTRFIRIWNYLWELNNCCEPFDGLRFEIIFPRQVLMIYLWVIPKQKDFKKRGECRDYVIYLNSLNNRCKFSSVSLPAGEPSGVSFRTWISFLNLILIALTSSGRGFTFIF